MKETQNELSHKASNLLGDATGPVFWFHSSNSTNVEQAQFESLQSARFIEYFISLCVPFYPTKEKREQTKANKA